MDFIKKHVYILVFLALAAGSIAVVSPKGDFPLNDDWVYAYSVQQLFDTGSLRLSEWVAPSTVSHVWWGYGWCRVFGAFSFETLRLSTLFLSVFAGVVFYFILIELGSVPLFAFFGVLLLFFNPVWFVQSFTYMTDIPYMFFCFLSVYLCLIGVRKDAPLYLVVGSIFMAYAYLMRQIGILIPAGVMLYLVFEKKLTIKKTAYLCSIPVLAALGHRYWLKYIHGYTWAYLRGEDLKFDFADAIPRILGSLIYLGAFLLPLCAGLFLSYKAKKKNEIQSQALIFVLWMAVIVYAMSKGFIPYFENVLNLYGLGAITVAGASAKASGLMQHQFFFGLLTCAGIVSVLYLITHILKSKQENIFINRASLLAVIVFVLQFAVAAVRYKFFDRYLLLLLPAGIIIGLQVFEEKALKWPAYAFLFLMLAFSVFGTADYMSWNRAKWGLGNSLAAKGLSHSQISNGFDWEGWYTFEPNMEKLKKTLPASRIGEWQWQSLNNYRALISFKQPDGTARGYQEVKYFSYLSFKKESIYAWFFD